MNNYQLHKKLESALFSLIDIREDMNVKDHKFYSKAVTTEASIKTVQSAMDNIQWTQDELNDSEDYNE